MLKSCSKCGKIHPSNYVCSKGKIYRGGEERKLRHTNAWKQKSIEIRNKANNMCEVCKDKGLYTKDGLITRQSIDSLEVHHITKIREDKTSLLDNYNLVCLCQFHHKQADNNKIDASYLRQLAKAREKN